MTMAQGSLKCCYRPDVNKIPNILLSILKTSVVCEVINLYNSC